MGVGSVANDSSDSPRPSYLRACHPVYRVTQFIGRFQTAPHLSATLLQVDAINRRSDLPEKSRKPFAQNTLRVSLGFFTHVRRAADRKVPGHRVARPRGESDERDELQRRF